jgi:hypothetical protein
MQAANDSTAPPRSGVRRLISPLELRHLRSAAGLRFTAGGFQLGIGVVLLGLGRRAKTIPEQRKCNRWAAWFLVNAALQVTGGCLDMLADRPAPPQT